jgi:PAS domain S-box-containing protein
MSSEKQSQGRDGPRSEIEGKDPPGSIGLKTEYELQQALEEAARHQRETLALLDAARAVMTHERFAEAAREIFDRCREVTGATSGYISLSNESGTENEVVFLEAGGLPCTVDPDLPMPIRGLRAESYKSGKVVYDNNFSVSDHVKFLPAGHVTMENVLFAPLKTQAQQTVGLLGLANKPGGFTEYDACLAEGFAELATIALVSKRAGEALKESEEKFRNIIESAPVGIFKSTREGKFLEVNPALAHSLGYDSSDELIQAVNKTSIAHQLYVSPGERPKVVEEILLHRDWFTYENQYRKKDSQVITASVKFRTVLAPDGTRQIEGFFEDVTERKSAEAALHRELAVTAALAQLHKPLVSPASSILTIAMSILEQAKELTGSEHGYVATIDPVTADLVCHTFTVMIKGQCQVKEPDRRVIFPRGEDGRYPLLWGHALNTRQPFFTNEPSSHPASKRVPAGHIPIHRFLSVPVMLGDELVGQIALANPGRDYTAHDLEAVRRLSEFYALALQRKGFEEELDKARAHLESKVKQRTEELLQSNVQLRKEVRERQTIEAELRQSEHRLRILTSQLLNAQEQERQRVSRELHDELGQSLMVLKLQIRNLEKKLAAEQGSKDSCLEVIRQLDEVIENVRRLSRDLSPTILEDLGLTVALQNLFDTFGRHYGIEDLTYHLDEIENLFPQDFQVNIYRIFQEALTNIGKYAQASKVNLTVRRGDGEVYFSIEDNGVGFNLEKVLEKDVRERGMGLAAMAERVRILGGSLHLESEEGRGTRISCRLPVAS